MSRVGFGRCGAGELLDQPTGDRGGEHGVAGGGHAHGVEESVGRCVLEDRPLRGVTAFEDDTDLRRPDQALPEHADQLPERVLGTLGELSRLPAVLCAADVLVVDEELDGVEHLVQRCEAER